MILQENDSSARVTEKIMRPEYEMSIDDPNPVE